MECAHVGSLHFEYLDSVVYDRNKGERVSGVMVHGSEIRDRC